MTKRLKAKQKISRRLGVDLWGRPNGSFQRRSYPPGEHGRNKTQKYSDYGRHLMEKQKLCGYYQNITEKQFLGIYKEAARLEGDTPHNLIRLLESRLDVAVYRLKFAPTFAAARQLVNHGHVLLNGKKATIPSMRIKEGDTVELCPESKNLKIVLDAQGAQDVNVPVYLVLDEKQLKGTLNYLPRAEDVPYPVVMDPHAVVEYYSR